MSVESAVDRRRKRIVEHVIDGFNDAQEAIRFGNTMEKVVEELPITFKFRQGIGSRETNLHITEGWTGKTALKTSFLEILGDEAAKAVANKVQLVVDTHNTVHHANVKILSEVIREKPQPQFIG